MYVYPVPIHKALARLGPSADPAYSRQARTAAIGDGRLPLASRTSSRGNQGMLSSADKPEYTAIGDGRLPFPAVTKLQAFLQLLEFRISNTPSAMGACRFPL